jgi:hypothetical protein
LPIQIYLNEVASSTTALTSTTTCATYSDYTNVFNSGISITTGAGWKSVTLATPYNLASGDNLIVATFQDNSCNGKITYYYGAASTATTAYTDEGADGGSATSTQKVSNKWYLPNTMFVFGAPGFSTQPAATTSLCTTSGSTTLSTVSTITTSEQWYYSTSSTGPWTTAVANGTPAGAAYTGATTAGLGISGITANGTYYYACIASNGNGASSKTTSSAAKVIVAACCVSPASVAYSGYTTPICTGSNPGTFTATASGGTGALTYLWYANGASTGATASTYTPGALSATSTFYCVATAGGTCSTTGANLVITVNAASSYGTITGLTGSNGALGCAYSSGIVNQIALSGSVGTAEWYYETGATPAGGTPSWSAA